MGPVGDGVGVLVGPVGVGVGVLVGPVGDGDGVGVAPPEVGLGTPPPPRLEVRCIFTAACCPALSIKPVLLPDSAVKQGVAVPLQVWGLVKVISVVPKARPFNICCCLIKFKTIGIAKTKIPTNSRFIKFFLFLNRLFNSFII